MKITHSLRSMKLWAVGVGLVCALGFTSIAQAWGSYGPVGYRGCPSCRVHYRVVRHYYRPYYHSYRHVRSSCCCYTCNTCFSCNTCNSCGYGYGYRYY